jgi:DNA-binding response OmpR family regulator
MQKILIVEDDKSTNQVICEVMKAEGYEVLSAGDGERALELFWEHQVSVVLLDIMLPKMSGLEVLREIKKKSRTPVIMLTAMGDEYTQIRSFDLQADEYVTKPFSPLVLAKRVKALLRICEAGEKDAVKIGETCVDFESYEATRNGERLSFTTRELQILKYLIENKGRVLSREQILDHVWGYASDPMDRTIDTHIKNLRRKLDTPCILTVKNAGYRFDETYLKAGASGRESFEVESAENGSAEAGFDTDREE